MSKLPSDSTIPSDPADGFSMPPPYSSVSPQQTTSGTYAAVSSEVPTQQAPVPHGSYTGMSPPVQPSVIVVQNVTFGTEPQSAMCQHCRSQIVTRIESFPTGNSRHLVFLACCLLGFCCCAPCVYHKDFYLMRKHYCPNCNIYLGHAQQQQRS